MTRLLAPESESAGLWLVQMSEVDVYFWMDSPIDQNVALLGDFCNAPGSGLTHSLDLEFLKVHFKVKRKLELQSVDHCKTT